MKWNNGAPPAAIPPAAIVGGRQCFEEGDRLPLPMVDRFFIDGIDSRCFDRIDVRELAWITLSSIDRCNLQKFYAFLIDLMYANNEERVIEMLTAAIGAGFQIRFHRGELPLPWVVTVVTNRWAVAIINGTLVFQQLALQAFQSLGGPTNQGTYSTLPLWQSSAVFVHQRLVADGMQPGTKLTLVGHSLGGAAATVAAARYHLWDADREIKLLTFATPKIGDDRLVEILDPINQLHICNDQDLVTILPPAADELAPFFGIVGLSLRLAWNNWRPAPHRVRLLEDGQFAEVNRFFDDYIVLLTAILNALDGVLLSSIEAHYVNAYVDRLTRRCPDACWPTAAPIEVLEEIAIGMIGLVGNFPQSPAAAAGGLQLRSQIETRPEGFAMALGHPEVAVGNLVLRSNEIEPVDSLGAIALASIPVFPCANCSFCTITPETFSFNPMTAGNGYCSDAAALNVLWTVRCDGICAWTKRINPPLCGGGNWDWWVYRNPAVGKWWLRLLHGGSYAAIWEYQGVLPWTCIGPRDVTLIFSDGAYTMPTTVTINTP